MTVGVETDATGVITRAAPIVRKFVGHPIASLAGWMRSHGGDFYFELVDGL